MKYEVTLHKITTDYAIIEVNAQTPADAVRKARRIVAREPDRFCDGDERIAVGGVDPK